MADFSYLAAAAPWFGRALMDFGVRPIPGQAENPRIVQWWDRVGINPPDDDNPSPCAAALGCWMAEAGIEPPPAYYGPDAWVSWGQPLQTPQLGCVAVVKGTNVHVGLVASIDEQGYRTGGKPSVALLGAAQAPEGSSTKQVCIGQWRPWTDFKAFRWRA